MAMNSCRGSQLVHELRMIIHPQGILENSTSVWSSVSSPGQHNLPLVVCRRKPVDALVSSRLDVDALEFICGCIYRHRKMTAAMKVH